MTLMCDSNRNAVLCSIMQNILIYQQCPWWRHDPSPYTSWLLMA